MLIRVIILIVIAIALYMLVRWFIDTSPENVKKQLKKVGIFLVAGIFILLALTGKLHWLFALLGGLIPFAQRLLTIFRGYQMFKNLAGQFKTMSGAPGGGPSSSNQGQTSTISTEWLKMTLDHDSGDLFGTVLQGQYRGKQLEEMPLNELIELLADCRIQDEESATLLETYLDRRFGEQWREQFNHEQSAGHSYGGGNEDVSLDEAYEILGLTHDTTLEEVKTAHKRLIQKLHPDRGGSSYLAAKINKAKDILVNHLEKSS